MTALAALFLDEVERQGQVLREGLRASADAAPTAELRYAAQAIVSAARVVGQDAAARLADALEQLLAAADAERRNLNPGQLGVAEEALSMIDAIARAGESTAGAALAGVDIERVVAALTMTSADESAGPAEAKAPVSPALLALFEQECEMHAAVLCDGVLQLERNPSRLELVDRMMRSAHSIKGAARVVGLDAAVALAHAAEDQLIRVQQGQVAMSPHLAEALLSASDLLQRIGAATAAGARDAAPTAALWQACVRALAGSDDDDDGDVAARSALAARSGALADDPSSPTRNPATSADLGSPTGARTVGVGNAVGGDAGDGDRFLRVRASHLSKLVALAGESLVETRRLKPFSDAWHRLRSRQSGIADLLDDLHQALGAPAGDTPLGERIGELRSRLHEARSAVSSCVVEFDEYARRTEDLSLRLFREATKSRMRPLSDGLAAFPRAVRDLGRRLGKQVDLVIVGDELRIDRDILERIEAPLNHLVRNAIDHGLETPAARSAAGKPERGSLRIEARTVSGSISITVSDDGAGIALARVRARVVERGLASPTQAAALTDERLLDHLFAPGFSTTDAVTEISGRGVGLDVVQSALREVGGAVHVTTTPGAGTQFHLRVPVSRSVLRSLIVVIAGEPHALPLSRVDRLLRVAPTEIRLVEDRPYIVVDGRNVALVAAAQILELDGAAPAGESLAVVVVADRGQRFGFVVDTFVGEQDLVIKALDPRLGRVADISAAAILADGAPVLIVDVEDLVRSVLRNRQQQRMAQLAATSDATAAPPRQRRILVVDDSITVRELERDLLSAQGYEVVTAVDGLAGWDAVRESDFDLVITDVDMPRLDGIALTRAIKQDARLRDVPVIIMSYRGTLEDRQRGLAAAADLYVAKADYDDQGLLQAVFDLIGPALP